MILEFQCVQKLVFQSVSLCKKIVSKQELSLSLPVTGEEKSKDSDAAKVFSDVTVSITESSCWSGIMFLLTWCLLFLYVVRIIFKNAAKHVKTYKISLIFSSLYGYLEMAWLVYSPLRLEIWKAHNQHPGCFSKWFFFPKKHNTTINII